jgi:hypothetical protein
MRPVDQASDNEGVIPIAGVLILIVVVFSVAVVVSNPQVFTLSIFGAGVPVTASGVYFNGAGAMLVFVLAALLLRRGVKRELARRKQVRALRRAAGVKKLPTSTPRRPAASVRQSTSGRTTEPSTATQHVDGATTASSPQPAGGPQPASGRMDPPSEPTSTTSADERRALLDEAEELTSDGPDR